MSTHETLGLLLVREGLISRPQLYDALRLQRQTNRLLGTCLLSLGYIDAERLLAILSRQLGVPALPPGTLGRASPQALGRLEPSMALRLRIVPYSWDGTVLGVAMADGRTLGCLQEVALHSRSAVGAYVALELEIEAALRGFYGGTIENPATSGEIPSSSATDSRPRPMLLTEPKRAPTRQTVIRGAPPPVWSAAPDQRGQILPAPLARASLYEAVELLYNADTADAIGRRVGEALLNYFARVLAMKAAGPELVLCGYAGAHPTRSTVPRSALPQVAAGLGQRAMAYGMASRDLRSFELASAFGLQPGATSLIATVPDAKGERLMFYADNGSASELYEELHDVELLLKEAETALAMLAETRGADRS